MIENGKVSVKRLGLLYSHTDFTLEQMEAAIAAYKEAGGE